MIHEKYSVDASQELRDAWATVWEVEGRLAEANGDNPGWNWFLYTRAQFTLEDIVAHQIEQCAMCPIEDEMFLRLIEIGELYEFEVEYIDEGDDE